MATTPSPSPPAPPLLEVDHLTLRFRGLVAVSDVSLAVNRGEIMAVIGPNGAGKTSLFNAITGIYQPTAGDVRFDGRDLRRPLRRARIVRWALLGLLTGAALFLLASDVNEMWAAVIKHNYRSPAEGFRFGQAARDLGAYLAAEPRIEQRAGRFFVTTFDGQTPFGSSRSEAEARAHLETLRRPGALAPDQIDQARAISRAAAGARGRRWLAFIFGFLLGAGGSVAVWRQTRRTPSWVAAQGIARTFQNIRLFQDMTVEENVLVGMRHLMDSTGPWRRRLRDHALPAALLAGLAALVACFRFQVGGPALWAALLYLLIGGAILYLARVGRMGAFSRRALDVEKTAREEARALLALVGLHDKRGVVAKNLPYGNQRRLEIARALATRPRLLLLDEPAAGMNPAETVELMKLIRAIRERGVTVLLIEHHMRVVMGISDRIAVLEYGQKIAEGPPEQIRADRRVIEAYLGKEDSEEGGA